MFKSLLPLSLVVLLAAAAPVWAADGKEAKQNAPQLVKDVLRATAFTGKAVKESGFDVKKIENRPFLDALRNVTESLKDADDRYQEKKKEDFLQGLSDATIACLEFKTVVDRMMIKDESLKRGVTAVISGVSLIEKNYGPEALLLRKGGALSDKEKDELQKMKAQQQEILSRLNDLRGRGKDDPSLLATIDDMEKRSHEISASEPTMTGYVAALRASAVISAEARALSTTTGGKYDVLWEAIGMSLDMLDTIVTTKSQDVGPLVDWSMFDTPIDTSLESQIFVTITDAEVTQYHQFVEEVTDEGEEGAEVTDIEGVNEEPGDDEAGMDMPEEPAMPETVPAAQPKK